MELQVGDYVQVRGENWIAHKGIIKKLFNLNYCHTIAKMAAVEIPPMPEFKLYEPPKEPVVNAVFWCSPPEITCTVTVNGPTPPPKFVTGCNHYGTEILVKASRRFTSEIRPWDRIWTNYFWEESFQSPRFGTVKKVLKGNFYCVSLDGALGTSPVIERDVVLARRDIFKYC